MINFEYDQSSHHVNAFELNNYLKRSFKDEQIDLIYKTAKKVSLELAEAVSEGVDIEYPAYQMARKIQNNLSALSNIIVGDNMTKMITEQFYPDFK